MSNTNNGIHIAQSDLTEAYTPFTLLAGDIPVLSSTPETILDTNAEVVQHSVLGRVTASRKLVLSALGAVDGSQVPIGVLAYACGSAPANADSVAPVYFQGHFNVNALVFDASYDTLAKKLAAFPDLGNIKVSKPGYST